MARIIICCLLAFTMKAFSQPQIYITPYATGIYGKTSEITTNGDGRLYVTTQLGYIYIIESGGNLITTPFLNINNKVTPTTLNNTGEQGLLGLAFSPNYTTDSSFYIYYTDKASPGNTVIARYKRSTDPNLADVNSEEVLLYLNQPYSNHNGGCMKFGSDGYLYIALGDGGSGGDPGNLAQNMNQYFGKILRIDVSQPGAYTIPPTNPFAGMAGIKNEIWSSGLRNPWKFSFDRLTHDLWMGDVGQNIWEEINFQPAASNGGENYGWRCYEGLAVFDTSAGCPGNYTAPIYVYDHASTGGCSVTGGYVYRGSAYASLYGYYFFADFCNSKIYALNPLGGNTVTVAGTFPGRAFSTFGEDDNGELYVADLINQTVYRITDNTSSITNINPNITSATAFYRKETSGLEVQVNSSIATNAQISIFDMKGAALFQSFFKINKGENKTVFSLAMTTGVYFVKITTPESVYIQRFAAMR